jgi:glycosyltransferase involved in cell wall biosynthesis
MDPLISIIIPCYNDAQYIEQSVQSALNQTYPYKEIIVVDDGSNAVTKAILKKLEPKIDQLITQENLGQSTARNVGIKAAKGEYILILDSDDYFEPTFCEEAITAFKSDENIVIVTCQANLLFPDGSTQLYIPQGGNIGNFMYTNCALGTSMFKKSDWARVGGYDETMRSGFEDWEFFIRLTKIGKYAFVIQKPLFNYRKRQFSTTSKANQIRYELWHYIFTKNKDLYVENFDNFVLFLMNKLKQAEHERLKQYNKIEYKIGFTLLKPLRFIKSLFK